MVQDHERSGTYRWIKWESGPSQAQSAIAVALYSLSSKHSRRQPQHPIASVLSTVSDTLSLEPASRIFNFSGSRCQRRWQRHAFAKKTDHSIDVTLVARRCEQHAKSMAARTIIRRVAGHGPPRILQGLFEERQIGRAIDQQDYTRDRNRGNELLNLEDASAVRWREAAQIHEHRVRLDSHVGCGHPPRVLMAVELLDPKQSVGIRYGRFSESRCSRS